MYTGIPGQVTGMCTRAGMWSLAGLSCPASAPLVTEYGARGLPGRESIQRMLPEAVPIQLRLACLV
jgi:hypothetical protein